MLCNTGISTAKNNVDFWLDTLKNTLDKIKYFYTIYISLANN